MRHTVPPRFSLGANIPGDDEMALGSSSVESPSKSMRHTVPPSTNPGAKITVDLFELDESSDPEPQRIAASVVKRQKARAVTQKGRLNLDIFDAIEPRGGRHPTIMEVPDATITSSPSGVSSVASLGNPDNIEHIQHIEQLRNQHRIAKHVSFAHSSFAGSTASDGDSSSDSEPEVVDLWKFNSVIMPRATGGGTQLPA